MQLGKATILEVNDERNAHKNVWQVVLFYFGFSRNRDELERLRNANTASEKKCIEREEKYRAAEVKSQAQCEKLATAQAAIAVSVVTVILLMIFPQTRFLIGAVGLSFALGGLLLPEANRLGRYVGEGLRLSASLCQFTSREISSVLGHIVQFVERIYRRIRDWRSKSVPVSRSFNTAP
jgi:hypothetical protein